jgi:hypothetical protein
MKFCQTDDAGHPIAYYDDAIHRVIPAEAFSITSNQWQVCIDNPGERRFENGKIVTCVSPKSTPLTGGNLLARRMSRDPVLAAIVRVFSEVLSQTIDFDEGEAIARIGALLEDG